eukprot:Blabericola_migrator_1__2908@NODE_1836_length_3711_cov_6_593030_g1176_i0_p3_GENE_NODE_1836_length_3711_cov_6_593030_g1176_i0NODE_1836_length_3711_cov_6_593030_g1176_i0_p3_ORF_typecomplete_len218_score20_03DUF2095/PF09868_9/0_086_NODE_1836_length_3711_cov_6_593030_g1176_i04591112
MLERFQASTGASGITHEEVSKLREQLRRSALLAFASHRHSDVLMHAAECYKLTKNYLLKRAGTALHSDMVRCFCRSDRLTALQVFELVLLARTSATTGNIKEGEVFKKELESLVLNTIHYIASEVAKSDLSDPDRIRAAWLSMGDEDRSISGPLIKCEPAVFLRLILELGELSALYGDTAAAEKFRERWAKPIWHTATHYSIGMCRFTNICTALSIL